MPDLPRRKKEALHRVPREEEEVVSADVVDVKTFYLCPTFFKREALARTG